MARQNKKPPILPLIFDTDILIWYLRGDRAARHIIESTDVEHRWLTSLSLMELMQGARSQQEMNDIQAFVAENFSRMIHPGTAISEKSIHLMSAYAASHGLRVIDAMIAASSLLTKSTLCTGNNKHFSFIPGLSVRVFKKT